jgi:cytoskeletal protein RodZ
MQLEDVSLATKVGTRFLRALEEERLDQLPGGIFNKGFIRAYARHLGLDENEIVADYLAVVEEKTSAAAGQPAAAAARSAHQRLEDRRAADRRSSDQRLSDRRSADQVPAAGQAQASQAAPNQVSTDRTSADQSPANQSPANQGSPNQSSPSPASPNQSPVEQRLSRRERRAKERRARGGSAERRSAPSAPLLKPKPAFHVPVSDLPGDHAARIPWGKMAVVLLVVAFGFALWGSFSRQPWEPRKPGAEKPVSSQPATRPSAKAADSAKQMANPEPPAADSAVPQTAASVVLSASSTSSGAPISPAPSTGQAEDSEAAGVPANGTFTVLIQAKEDSWLQITVDGKEVMQEVLVASRHKAVAAQKEVVIKAGNIGGLEFSFNGRKLPAQGEEDEVKTLTFGAEGLQLSRKPLEAQTGRPQA